jgi:putative flippase GtrA
MLLGIRQLSGTAPARSRFGNAMTRRLFQLSTGRDLHDTQTGLRGYPGRMLTWLAQVPGERYEYELSVLLRGVEQNLDIDEIPITAVYSDHNSSSHFRTITDSVRVYAPLLRFSASSVLAFVLDTTLLLILSAVTGNLLISVLGARLFSSFANFSVNRLVVFRHSGRVPLRTSAARYFALAGVIVMINLAVIGLLNQVLAVPLLPAKIVTELLIFCISFLVQRLFVFSGRSHGAKQHLTSWVRVATGTVAQVQREWRSHHPSRLTPCTAGVSEDPKSGDIQLLQQHPRPRSQDEAVKLVVNTGRPGTPDVDFP